MPTSQRPIPNEILLSLATAPLLIGLLAGKTIANLVKSASEASEEILRGDRLPFLDSSTDFDRS
ncbi:hypothetical protein H6F67_23740 [Microcoleus sp. FACHB-1515]|uniref:hypothetical protein n=1 Tax=Cyanophyceae TaxID=3028117 RepID=UPI001687FA02|nr:hypothetical protein [Microcoleus sp. FACHB-1515]MBD2092866.1 hypothetical protein [Microcoleus sp. FACHB-1515]